MKNNDTNIKLLLDSLEDGTFAKKLVERLGPAEQDEWSNILQEEIKNSVAEELARVKHGADRQS